LPTGPGPGTPAPHVVTAVHQRVQGTARHGGEARGEGACVAPATPRPPTGPDPLGGPHRHFRIQRLERPASLQ
jgi:hypothetical protein